MTQHSLVDDSLEVCNQFPNLPVSLRFVCRVSSMIVSTWEETLSAEVESLVANSQIKASSISSHI